MSLERGVFKETPQTYQKVPLSFQHLSHSQTRPQHQCKILQHQHHHKTPTTHSQTINFHQYSLHYHCHHNRCQHRHHYPHRQYHLHQHYRQHHHCHQHQYTNRHPNARPHAAQHPYTDHTTVTLHLTLPHLSPNFAGFPPVGTLGGLPYHPHDNNQRMSPSLGTSEDISKNKWICFSIYRPSISSNLTIFFDELTKVLSKAVLKYENNIPLDGTHLDAVRGLI